MRSWLVFPFLNVDGSNGYARVKPDQPRRQNHRVVKYESPRGRPNEVFVPRRTCDVLNDATVPLLITEGEKKAPCADQNGLPCLGLVGVWGWKVRQFNRLLPALESVNWQGREVTIVFDSDVQQNVEVEAAETRLAALLARRGAAGSSR